MSPRRTARVLAVAVALSMVAVLGGPVAADTDQARWFRIAFTGRIAPADHAAVSHAGARLLQYLPHDRYLAFGNATVRGRIRAIEGVERIQLVGHRDKVAGELGARSGVIPVTVIADPITASDHIVGAKGDVTARYTIGAGLGAVDLVIHTDALDDLAALPGVVSIVAGSTGLVSEDEGSAQILAGAVPAGGRPEPGYRDFLAAHGLDGDGVTVSVLDDGLDPSHPDLAGRIARRYHYGGENAVIPAEGHGTHVAGILGGSAAALPLLGPVRDRDGLRYGLGIAPRVTFVDHPTNQMGAGFPFNGGWADISRDAVRAGSIAWNASWTDGGGAGAGYVVNAAVMDGIVRDADQETDGPQPLTLVFSAGNAGEGHHRVTSPKEAKNIITVASSGSHRAGDVDAISRFSSRGPAVDGRIVPTVAAPGEGIISARAATGVFCTIPLDANVADIPPPDGFGLYTGCSGTSMAAPHVTGAVALIHQWWGQRADGSDPSPAMDRALLVNAATDLGDRDVPNRHEGWGRVDLGRLFDPTLARVLLDQAVVFTSVGQVHSLVLEAVDPTRPLRATLAWTDPPGVPFASPALVNDLDLVVTTPDGRRHLGNVFVGGVSVPSGVRDELNNLENVFLDRVSPGPYTVRVLASNLPGDGVPWNDTPLDQDFALVVTNARVAGVGD